MSIKIILLAIIIVLAIVLFWQYWNIDLALVVVAAITGAYIIIRTFHALGGRGGNISVIDVFLLCYAVAFWAFLIDYWWDLNPEETVFVILGIIFFFLWVVLNSGLIRRGITSAGKSLFSGRPTP